MAHQISDEKMQALPATPDGATPGSQFGPARSKHDFDADARAADREAAAVTIGGIVYHRRRKNWEATRALRALLRRQERAAIASNRARKRIDALDADAPDDDLAKLEDQIDAATDESDEAAYGIIALLLRTDDGAGPDIDHLKASLDVEDAGDLAANLAGGGEPDPTPTTPSSSST